MTHTGGCLCGGVRYTLTAPLREIIACHCSQCRRTSGHFVAATSVPTSALVLDRSDTLAWYVSSAAAERGFCNRCGGNLFWRPTHAGATDISIMAGTIDPPTGVRIGAHIFVRDKSDYYAIDDGVPQTDGWNV